MSITNTVYTNVINRTIPGTAFAESDINTLVSSYLTSTVSGVTILESHANTANNYKTFSGTITLTLTNPAVTIVNVYSGGTTASGTYPTTASGNNGAGWVQSGTSLLFTNGSYTAFSGAATNNQVPASGANFWVNYTYNSTSYPKFSGSASISLLNPNAMTIFAVYSGNSTASGTYSTTASGANGAGWSQSGQNLVFTNGGYMDFGAAATANQIPSSGSSYWIDYSYLTTSGTTLGTVTEALSFPGLTIGSDVVVPNVANRFAR